MLNKVKDKCLVHTIRHCLVLFLFITLATVGCASQQSKLLKKKQQDVLASYKLQVSETIDDPERAKQLIALSKDLHREMRTDTKMLQKMFEELDTLNKSYKTRREELETALKVINNHRRKMREKIFAARVNALSLTTPEEWQALMSRRRTLMDLIQETPGLL